MTVPQLICARLQNTLWRWGTTQARFLHLQLLGDVGSKPHEKPGYCYGLSEFHLNMHRFQSEQKTGMCDTNHTQKPGNDSTVIKPQEKPGCCYRLSEFHLPCTGFSLSRRLACVTGIILRTLIMIPLLSQDCRVPQFMWKLAL